MTGKLKKKIYEYLRMSEKYTKTDMIYLVKNTSWVTIGQAGNILITFILSVIFANFLSKESYGVYAYVLSLIGIIGLAGLPGIKLSLTRTVSAGFEGALQTAVKEKFKWNIFAAVISFGAAFYYFIQGNFLLGISLLLAAFFFPVLESATLYDNFLTGKKMFKHKTLYFLTTRLGFLAAIFITLQFTRNVFYILLTYFTVYAIFRIIFYILTVRFFQTKISYGDLAAAKKEMISYAKNLSLMNILSQIAGQIDKIIVFHFLNGAGLAVYSFALAPVQQMKSLINPLDALLFPKFVERGLPEIKKRIIRKMFFLAGLTLLMIASYIAIAPYFYNIFFPQYKESIFYSRIYSIALIFAIIIIPKTALEAHAKIKSLYMTKIVQPIVKITLLLTLTIYYGIFGTISALLISQLFNFLFTTYLFKKESARSI
jgi:O-antigen/teichoic acid export membrane protein